MIELHWILIAFVGGVATGLGVAFAMLMSPFRETGELGER